MEDKQQYHFYASSLSTWKVDNDLHRLIAYMDSEGYGYNLLHIPVPIDSDYEIRMYMPVVEGTTYLGYKSTAEIRGGAE
jgi:hypothetical protein